MTRAVTLVTWRTHQLTSYLSSVLAPGARRHHPSLPSHLTPTHQQQHQQQLASSGQADTYCSQMWRCVIEEEVRKSLASWSFNFPWHHFLEPTTYHTFRVMGEEEKASWSFNLHYLDPTHRACQRCFLESVIWSNICRARVSGAGRSVNNVNVSIVCTVCILGSYYYALSPAWPHQRNSFVLMTCTVEASTQL